MELLKLDERPAEATFGDVTFLFRAVASTGDKFVLDTAGEMTEDGKIKFIPWDFYKNIIKQFVVGWKGVTEDGVEVPYSFDTLFNRLPTGDEDMIMNLALQIAERTGIMKKKPEVEAEKNA